MVSRRMRTVVIAFALAALATLAVPTADAATTRYAAPAAQGTGDCSSPSNACPLSTAVTMAASGDTIDVLGNLGDYSLGAGSIAPGSSKALQFVGIDGTPRLIANSSSPTLDLEAASSSATNLYVENDGSGDTLTLEGASSSATNLRLENHGTGDALVTSVISGSGSISLDRLFAKTTGTPSHTCLITGGVTLGNSVCWQANSAAGSDGVLLEGTNTLRNDVSWVSGSGAAVDCGGYYFTCDGTVINTIARTTGSGGADLQTYASVFPATLTVRHSNFGTARAGGKTADDHFDTDSTDQHSPPLLTDPGAGDFHELSTSPTINAGVTDPANGAADLDGKPRVVNARTDIGAYELGTPGAPSGTKITMHMIKRHRRRASFRFTAAGAVSGFQCALVRQKKGTHHRKPKLTFAPCSSGKTYKHLKHGRYVFEVRAFNPTGVDPKPATERFRL